MARKVVITGGSSGIGLATAKKFLEAGDSVVICGRSEEKLAAAKEFLPALEARVLDVRDQSAVEALFEELQEIDVLVLSAGVCLQARLDDEDSDQVWQQTMDINVNGVYYGLKAGQKRMGDGGTIITISSGLGKNARAGYEAYTASKHAVLGLTKSVALELAPRNIRVNAVCPGWVDTPMSRVDAAEGARRAGLEEEVFRAQAVEGIPLGRMVGPEDVADLIFFLASDEASMITGQSYNIAGGEFLN